MRLALAICLLLAAAGRAEDDRPDRRVSDPDLQQKINVAIDKGVAYLKRVQENDGAWRFGSSGVPGEHYDGGITALALYALAASRVPKNDPAMVRGVRWTAQHKLAFGPAGQRATYCASLLVLALTRIDPRQHATRIRTLTGRIVEGQLPSDMWTYTLKRQSSRGSASGGGRGKGGKKGRNPGPVIRPSRGDNSNSQFAVLALWAAATLAQVEVPQKTWKRINGFYKRTQSSDGSWDYQGTTHGRRSDRRLNRPTMTAAGLVSFVYSTAALNGGLPALAKARRTFAARRGLAHFLDSPRPFNNYYYVYSLERVGTVLSVPEQTWYIDGARKLLQAQSRDGSWTPRGGRGKGDAKAVYETSLALLFLSRATAYAITPGGDSKPAGKRSETPGAANPAVAMERMFADYLRLGVDERSRARDKFARAGVAVVGFLIHELRNSDTEVRSAAYELLTALVQKKFFFVPDWPRTERGLMIVPIEDFWRLHKKQLRYDPKRRLFVVSR